MTAQEKNGQIPAICTHWKRALYWDTTETTKPQKLSRKAVKHEDETAVERILEIKKEEKIKILQFHRNKPEEPIAFESLEDLLIDISKVDLQCKEDVQIIFSGNNEFPYSAREQWTDSCNLLALKEGVVLGYDRNDKTTEAFKNAGFTIKGYRDWETDRKSAV